MLRLHKALLEMERNRFERTHGRVNSGELLQLVLNDEQFAWLRMISALVVQIDEMLDADEPATRGEAENLVNGVRQLLTSSDNEDFRAKYQAAMQQEPDVVMDHSTLMKMLRSRD